MGEGGEVVVVVVVGGRVGGVEKGEIDLLKASI